MKIGIITAHDEHMQEIGALSTYDKHVYCLQHGYELLTITKGFDKTRPAAWSKLLFIQDALPKYEWLLWMDADILIMNKSIKVESYIDDRFDLIMGRYEMNSHAHDLLTRYTIHTGCFLIKNSAWAYGFIPVWYGQDQFRFIHLLEEKAFTWLHLTMRGVNQHTKILPLKSFCTMAPHSGIIHTKLRECIYQPGDFIMHFLEMPKEKKLPYMQSVFYDMYGMRSIPS